MSKVILFQGDSITDCQRTYDETFNARLGNGYANLCAAELLYQYPNDDLKIYNRGISGHRIVDLYARWKFDALNLKPDYISILIGVNDTWHEFSRQNGVELDRYETVYRMLLEWTIKTLPNVKIILLEPFSLPSEVVTEDFALDVAKRAIIVKKLAEEFSLTFVPIQETLTKLSKNAPDCFYSADGVHPTPAGHKVITNLWLEAFGKLNG